MTQLPATAPTAAKKPGPGLGISIGILVTGLVVGVVSLVYFVRPFWGALSSAPAHLVPGQFQQQLTDGEYLVYERTGTTTGTGGFTFHQGQCPCLTPNQVTVTGPTGQQVAVLSAGSTTETLSRGSIDYTGVVRFDVTTDGIYTIRVTSNQSDEVIVAKTLGDSFHDAAPWLAPMSIGGIAFIAGVVMLIVGIVRRSNNKKQAYGYATYSGPYATPAPAQATTAAPAPGWYADPADGTRWRWWDGTSWTDRTS